MKSGNVQFGSRWTERICSSQYKLVGNAEGVANAIGYANAAVATLAGVAVVVLAVVGAVFTVK